MAEPTPPQPPGNLLERGASIVRSLNLTNVLILALIVVVAVPAYFAWRFMNDAEFRGEFMSGATVLDQFAPCTVLETHRYGSPPRHSIFLVYGFDERLEKFIGMRAPGTLTEAELTGACKKVILMARAVMDLPAIKEQQQ